MGNFYIVPGAMIDRNPVVNMPFNFDRPDNGYAPIPHYGLRSWDQGNVPNSPREWNDIPIVMSSYNGNLVMWQAHVPYKMVSGDQSQFHSGAARYFERAQEAAGGPSIFPNYDNQDAENNEQNKGNETDDDSDGEVIPSGTCSNIFSF